MTARAFTYRATAADGSALRGEVEIHPGGVDDDRKITNAAWHRAVDAAQTNGADLRRLVRVSRAANSQEAPDA